MGKKFEPLTAEEIEELKRDPAKFAKQFMEYLDAEVMNKIYDQGGTLDLRSRRYGMRAMFVLHLSSFLTLGVKLKPMTVISPSPASMMDIYRRVEDRVREIDRKKPNCQRHRIIQDACILHGMSITYNENTIVFSYVNDEEATDTNYRDNMQWITNQVCSGMSQSDRWRQAYMGDFAPEEEPEPKY